MKAVYSCPKCQATLNPNVKVILRAEKKGVAGLVLLDPSPGIYEVIAADELRLDKGDRVAFHCPVCREELTSRVDENLAELSFHGSDGRTGRVDFSRVYGEHATYFVAEGEVKSFGAQSDLYAEGNFFGEAIEDA